MRNLEFLELKRSKKTFYLQHHFQGPTRRQSFEANHQETCFKHHHVPTSEGPARQRLVPTAQHPVTQWWEIPKKTTGHFCANESWGFLAILMSLSKDLYPWHLTCSHRIVVSNQTASQAWIDQGRKRYDICRYWWILSFPWKENSKKNS